MDIVFEKAKKQDILKLIEVQKLSFEEEFIQYGECPPYNEKIEDMEHLLENELVYKIIADGEIIGDIIIVIKSETFYYFRTLSIIPSYQNLGIGKKAIKFIEKDNPKVSLWRLITSKENQRNCYFYESMGYVNVREVIRSKYFNLISYEKNIN